MFNMDHHFLDFLLEIELYLDYQVFLW
jgi:hypothetical protein